MIERRLFVVGVPRSGTTLVQSLLAAHSRLTSFTESHFFSRHFRPLPGRRALLTRDPGPRVTEFLVENGETWPAALIEPRRWFPGRSVVAGRRFLDLLDALAERRGASGWVEKTPRHLRFAPFLERVVGDSDGLSFVHVVREGLATVASLHRASQSWERPYGLDECAERWNREVAFSLRRVGRPRDHFVFYEELTADPEGAMRSLLASLGLAWEPAILEGYAESSSGLVTVEEAEWKEGIARAIRPSSRVPAVLTEEEQARATSGLRLELYDALRVAVETERVRTGRRSGRRGISRLSPRVDTEETAPAISVIVPFHDSERHLAACLEGLLAAREAFSGEAELILVDNGARDRSPEIGNRYPGFVRLSEREPGAYAARNAGIRHSRGSICAFTDADCVVEPDWLARIVESIRDRDLGVLVGRVGVPEEASLPLRLLAAWENAKAAWVLEHDWRYHFAWANNLAVRREVFERLGLFREWRRAGDTELLHRLAQSDEGLTVGFESAVRVEHLEFVTARDRLCRLRVYTGSNAKIESFRELGWRQRLRVAAGWLARS